MTCNILLRIQRIYLQIRVKILFSRNSKTFKLTNSTQFILAEFCVHRWVNFCSQKEKLKKEF
jgi:hypothetical protein